MNKKKFADISQDGHPARFYLLGLTLVLSAGVFAFDMTTSQVMVCTVPYVFMVLVGLWMPQWYIMTSAYFGTFLTVFAYFYNPPRVESIGMSINRSLCLFAVWVAAILCKQCKRGKDVLVEKNAYLQAFVDNALDGKIVTDDNGNIELFNASAERMFGYGRGEANGKNISLLIFDEQADGKNNDSNVELAKLSRKRVEAKGKRKDGSVFPLEFTVMELHVAGRLLFIAAAHDITERKELEIALREGEQRLQSIIDNTPAVIYMKQSDGRHILINRQFEVLFNTTNDAMKGKLDSEFFPQSVAATLMANDRQVVSSGKPLIIEETVPLGDDPHTYISVKFPLRDRNENIYAIAGISTDITERKRMEIALQEYSHDLERRVKQRTAELQNINELLKIEIAQRARAEEGARKLSRAIEQSPSSVMITDTMGAIEYVNPKFTQLSGYTMEETFGKNPRFLKADNTSFKTYKELWETIYSGGEWHGEFHNRRKDGGAFWGAASISAIRNSEGVITHFLSVMEDITERKRIEAELKTSLAEKDILLKEVHHRTKNNMQVISSLLRLQSRHIPDKKYADMFQDSFNRIRAMSLIHEKVYKTATLSHVDSGDYIASLTQNILRAYGGSDKVTLKTDADRICLSLDMGIPVGLIVNELVSNALKHAFPEERRGTLEVSLRYAGQNLLQLIVRDDGVGIPDGIDFRRSQSLGLQLVVMQVEDQLHGNITCERNNGTIFTIGIPINYPDAEGK